ncbi:MAG: Winged helix DNA-binding domain [Chloroflexi bacterium]|jgi:DNA-binding MarR family transcriptional regulator|nr:Winged helix DNA-binding domain [Chloroflexota bacterium]
MRAAKPKSSKILDIPIEENIPRVFVLFFQTAYAIEKYAEIELTRAGLSISKLVALQILQANGGTALPSTIAFWMLRERHNITTLVDRLTRDGLVTAERENKGDRRKINVTLTSKGRRALKRTRPVMKRIVDRIMATMNDSSAASLEKQLKVLRSNAQKGLDETARARYKSVVSPQA